LQIKKYLYDRYELKGMSPLLSPYEEKQRTKTLTFVIWVTLVASLLLTLFNLQFGSRLSLISLFILDILCIIALVLNARDYYFFAAIFISVMILIAITFNIYDGDGVFDPGVVAYPIFITVGTLILGKRSVLGFTLSSVISLLLIGFLQSRGMIGVSVRTNDVSNLIPLLILTSVAGLTIWIIMANTEKNFDRIKHSEAELRLSYEMTLSGWAKALEYRDHETEGHSRRVVHLSEEIAKTMGCSEEEIQNIRRGAILHDIGKMGIPDSILLKPGPLDPYEWDIMRQHPQYGKDILAGIGFLEPALSIVYCHHERWDGYGYPQGLKNKDIPTTARIFAIVDTWDALNSNRPYRKAWPSEKVIDFIQQNAGTMFDPDIVDIFLKMDKS
jgi:putative nucleotidyltransferase with HDIG domain